jgi:hypothetical protein
VQTQLAGEQRRPWRGEIDRAGAGTRSPI